MKKIEQASVWSEEDEEAIGIALSLLREQLSENKYPCLSKKYVRAIRILKSIKERTTWKPSEEQIKVLNEVLNFAANHESPYWDYIFGTLNNLKRQLKKLREE